MERLALIEAAEAGSRCDSEEEDEDDDMFDGAMGSFEQQRAEAWRCRRRAALGLGVAGALAALASAAWRGAANGGSGAPTSLLVADAGRELQLEATALVAVVKEAEEPFSCGKFGCLDIRSPTHPCQCSHFCVDEKTCCPDYQAVCANLTPATNPRLGNWTGCDATAGPPPNAAIWHYQPGGQPLTIKVMSYNPEWWHVIEQMGGNGNGPAKVIMSAQEKEPIDFIGFQEFYDPWWGLTRPGFDGGALLRDYMFVRGEVGGPVGTIIAYRRSAWSLVERGQTFVAEDVKGPNYYGRRIVLWARLHHRATGKTAFVANHHGPLPINSGGRCGPEVTAANVLRVIGEHALPGDVVVFMGDFNADGASRTVARLSQQLRSCFPGIDHILHNLPAEAATDARGWGTGGSDHSAISVVLRVPGA